MSFLTAIQGIKENQRQQSDADFFAQHPQPTLQEARFLEQEARLNQICLEQELDLGPTLDEALEAEENDDALALAAAALNNDYDDEGMINNYCNDVCACIRYFEDPEDQDSALYERKCAIQLDHSLQSKRQKCFDENQPIPMDISEDEDEDQSNSDNDDEEESEFICQHGNNCANQVCYDCVWYLEQEARRAYPRGKETALEKAVEVDYYADMIMPTLDDVGSVTDIPMDQEEEQEPRPPIQYQRQTTCWVDEETGETVYNGNADGSRYNSDDELPDLIDVTAEQEYDDAAEERYNFNMYELEVTYRNGKDVYDKHDAEIVRRLIREIEEYEKTGR